MNVPANAKLARFFSIHHSTLFKNANNFGYILLRLGPYYICVCMCVYIRYICMHIDICVYVQYALCISVCKFVVCICMCIYTNCTYIYMHSACMYCMCYIICRNLFLHSAYTQRKRETQFGIIVKGTRLKTRKL